MGQRYNVHFKDYKNTAYDVKVYIEGYVGQVTELLGARSAFTVEGNDENFVYEPIRSSTATLTLLGSDLLLDLFSINNQYAPVKLFKGDKLMWTGYIVPEQFTQPYKPTPDNISIDCISAIGTLENIRYKQQNEDAFIKAIDLLRYILKSANGGYEKIYTPLRNTITQKIGFYLKTLFLRKRISYRKRITSTKCWNICAVFWAGAYTIMKEVYILWTLIGMVNTMLIMKA